MKEAAITGLFLIAVINKKELRDIYHEKNTANRYLIDDAWSSCSCCSDCPS
jgi:hypothetical protein